MTRLTIIILLFLINGCGFNSGTLGGGTDYKFSCSRAMLFNKLHLFLKRNEQYVIPQKYRKYDNWKEKGYDFLPSSLFYFEDSPKEIYYVTLVKSELSDSAETNPSYLAVRSKFNFKDSTWINGKFWSDKEKKRIDARFKLIVDELRLLEVSDNEIIDFIEPELDRYDYEKIFAKQE